MVFWTKFAWKGHFRYKIEKRENYHWILHIRISLSTKFCLSTILIFGLNFPRKGISTLKQIDWTLPLNSAYSNYSPNFSINSQFINQIYLKGVFPVKNGKSERHHWNLYIRISLSSKFQLKQIILIFKTNLPNKGI